MAAPVSIQIPMLNSNEFIEIYPDELPVTGGDMDYIDLIDVLRSELAPLKVWSACAVEYHRQGLKFEFNAVLKEIVDSLADPSVEEIYRSRPEYTESAADIYNSLAAAALMEMGSNQRDGTDDAASRVIDNLRKADQQMRLNEYSWIIKGFYELKQGDVKRAEDHFKNVNQVAGRKRKFLFAGHVGLGIVAAAQQKYSVALEQFVKAVQVTPSCGASIRVAIGYCCFKLEQYERAMLAVERAIYLDPANANALLLLALLEQVKAHKCVGVSADHARRIESRQNAYEYCMLVCAVDPSSCMALVHMANHCSHTWKHLSDGISKSARAGHHSRLLSDRISIIVHSEYAKEVTVGDHVRVNSNAHVFLIVQINGVDGDDDQVILTLNKPVAETIVPAFDDEDIRIVAEVKEFGRVFMLAFEAINHTTDKEIQAEAYYVMGKAYHMQGQMEKALTCYRKSLAEAEFILAAFGAAQIQLSKHELASSFDLFERVYQKFPDDKDAKAFYFLVKALHKKQLTPMDQLKEVAIGFQFEADLWVAQGQLRCDNPSEYQNALKCLMNGLECMEHRQEPVDSLLLSNIAVLQHAMGKLQSAVSFGKRALIAAEHEITSDSSDVTRLAVNPAFRSADLDGVFFGWSAPRLEVRLNSDGSFHLVRFLHEPCEFSHLLTSGNEVIIGDVIHKIVTVADDGFTASNPVKLRRGHDDTSCIFQVRIKTLWHNFSDNLVTMCFNYARMLEDVGSTNAAIEIYVELLKQHPSYMECYLRLSRISRDMGRFDNASMWLSRALSVNSGDPDVNICLGDLYSRGKLWEDAKKCYEKICGQKHHDSRAMLSLGNFYFSTLSMRDAKYETHLKDSYKFFHHVLNEDHRNVYAAIGLGMICTEKGELEVAREIFSRAREANMSQGDDICIDLAHVHFSLGRYLDAEHQYIATLKAAHKDRNVRSDRLASLCEYAAMAQFSNKRYDEATKALLRAVHYDPIMLRFWYNSAVVHSDVANQLMQKPRRTVADIEMASEELNIAQKLFLFLGNTSILQPQGAQFQKEFAMRHARICEANKHVFLEQLQTSLEEEQRISHERRRQEEEHNLWRTSKEEEKARKLKAIEDEKVEKQLIAVQKSRKLDELKEKWVAVPTTAEGKKGKSKHAASAATADDSDHEGGVKSNSDSDSEVDLSPVPPRGSSPVAETRPEKADLDNIFGSDDDDDDNDNDVSNIQTASKKRNGVESDSISRKRLKKASENDSGEDSDVDFTQETMASRSGVVIEEED